MNKEYDGIIIGAGHNGLIHAGYLAKAGLKILIVERQLEIGGGLDAHEGARAGFWHNAHSVNHRGVADLMWYKDLGLAELGQQYIRLPVSVALLTRDHKALLWYSTESEKTAASIARFSAKDAKTYLETQKKFLGMARDIFLPEVYSPPVPFEKKKAILERSEPGRQYLEWSNLSINQAACKLFENEVVRGMFTFVSVIRGYESDSKGLGMFIPAAVVAGVNTQMAKGTSHTLAHTLHKMVVKSGVHIVASQGVERIHVENGRAVGVRTADGREFRARKFVSSTVNPNQTFLDMVGRENLTPQFAEKVDNFKYSNTVPVFTVHFALNERIYWKAADWEPEVDRAWLMIIGVDGMKDIEGLYETCNARRLPRSVNLIGAQPAMHDPTQAPPGKCTAFFWQIAPGNLCEEEGGRDRWDKIRDEFAERLANGLRHYAKNLTPDNIVAQFGVTPIDNERHLPNMHGGDVQCGELSENQILDKRPFPECSQYRTPIKGLYICGASTHPGGNITGAPGYNAAGIICQDLNIEPWWKARDAATHWESIAAAEAGKTG
ncbi:MAG: NAD(P)/FAD-dependent oxidoreductase [Betaproteobacteria bacterium]|nr:NAD(P)/FAD-dependent oxidoreductase [Betaproteobacteria bacterium]